MSDPCPNECKSNANTPFSLSIASQEIPRNLGKIGIRRVRDDCFFGLVTKGVVIFKNHFLSPCWQATMPGCEYTKRAITP